MSLGKVKYVSTHSLTITLASLADAGVRESTVVDNETSVLYVDASLYVQVAVGTPMGSDKQIRVWLYGGIAAAKFDYNLTGVDAAVTIPDVVNWIELRPIATPTASVTYKKTYPSLATSFGGLIPARWGVVIQNKTGAAFAASGHLVQYQGIHQEQV